jgi:hypothetical protein
MGDDRHDEWSFDEALGAEAFEQGDEAFDEVTGIDPDALEAIENDPSLDPALQLDELELEEIGAELDDPEKIVTLEGGSDDPDGLPGPLRHVRVPEEEGWGLDVVSEPAGELEGQAEE